MLNWFLNKSIITEKKNCLHWFSLLNFDFLFHFNMLWVSSVAHKLFFRNDRPVWSNPSKSRKWRDIWTLIIAINWLNKLSMLFSVKIVLEIFENPWKPFELWNMYDEEPLSEIFEIRKFRTFEDQVILTVDIATRHCAV